MKRAYKSLQNAKKKGKKYEKYFFFMVKMCIKTSFLSHLFAFYKAFSGTAKRMKRAYKGMQTA